MYVELYEKPLRARELASAKHPTQLLVCVGMGIAPVVLYSEAAASPPHMTVESPEQGVLHCESGKICPPVH